MELHAALIAIVPASFDPASPGQPLEHVANGRPLHSQAQRELRGVQAGILADACQRTVHRDGRIGHALELAIQGPHAIDQRTRGEQRVSLEDAAGRAAGRLALGQSAPT